MYPYFLMRIFYWKVLGTALYGSFFVFPALGRKDEEMKSYNHGLAEKEFRKVWKRQSEEYREAGMSEEMILQMYEYEREVFNSDRRYLEHYMEAEFIWENSSDNSSENAKMAKKREKYIDAISVFMPENNTTSLYDWVEEIDNPELYKMVSSLKKEEIELLTLFAIEGYSVVEIARLKGISHQNISKKINRIKKVLKNFN